MDVESLAGYGWRLAAYHRVTPYTLIKYRPPNLDPCFDDAIEALGVRYDTEFRSGDINGSAQGAVVARALAKLTGHPSVSWTTFFAYNGNAGICRFLQPGLRWCPSCLMEDAVPYERLLWNARLLTVCPHHQIHLQSVCPHCGFPGARHIVQGMPLSCLRCKKPVFTGARIKSEPSPVEIAESQSVAQFCRALFERSVDLTKYSLVGELCRFAEERGARSVGKKADFLGVSIGSLSGWQNGFGNISLVRFIEICSSLGIAPLQLLLKADVRTTIGTKGRNKARSRFWTRPKNSVRRLDKEHLRSQLLEAHENNPTLGVRAIARLIRQEPTKFFHWFPTLCHSITEQACEARRQQRLRKVKAVEDEVGDIIKTLIADGVRPTMRNIAQRMKSPGWFRSPEIRRHMTDVLSQLDSPRGTMPANAQAPVAQNDSSPEGGKLCHQPTIGS
jgi:transcriptional regulator with XRE-family HTH domain